jgi:hypothetical protein
VAQAYVVAPGGIMVPQESPIIAPEHLVEKEIAVGYHSGSHFTTLQPGRFHNTKRANFAEAPPPWSGSQAEAIAHPNDLRRVPRLAARGLDVASAAARADRWAVLAVDGRTAARQPREGQEARQLPAHRRGQAAGDRRAPIWVAK